ncbi:hypothetical protein [Amycolatopsis acididurans]|uniref:hypothetical protein n=1 Tax=Amycolatopsis acididurans TaxID=2724524 RepID=UPI001B32DB27|nr:hypothetical protein [Amycolatopsis acididurans]
MDQTLAGRFGGGAVPTRGVDCDGGWAEYTLATVDTLVPIPDELPFEQAWFSRSVSDVPPLAGAPKAVTRLSIEEADPVRLVLKP